MHLSNDLITVRSLSENDVNDFHKITSDFETNKFEQYTTISNGYEESLERLQQNISNYEEKFFTIYEYAITENNSDKLIGLISLNLIDSIGISIYLGIRIFRSFQNMKYGTEAIKMMINHLFSDKTHYICCASSSENKNAIKVLEKLNFRKVGHITNGILINSRLHDLVYYEINKDEWKNYMIWFTTK